MLLRLRVRLPDRPGSLGQVARTLGVTGADIVQMVVLERIGGRAVDDFTVIWPAAAPVDRILAGLGAIPGVAVEGVWRSVGAPAVHVTEIDRLAQIVRAGALVLGGRLDQAAGTPGPVHKSVAWPVNVSGNRLAAVLDS